MSGQSYGTMNNTAQLETTKLIPYPEDAEMQAELIEWQKRLTQYALKSKCGAAMGDETLTLETAMLGAAATPASQLWGIVTETCQHSKTIELEIEAL